MGWLKALGDVHGGGRVWWWCCVLVTDLRNDGSKENLLYMYKIGKAWFQCLIRG